MNQVYGQRNTMKTGLVPLVLGLICVLVVPAVGFGDESPVFQKLGDAFRREIRPILDQHCMKCHAADVQEGTLDLEQFATLEDVRRSTKTWLKVAEMLDNGEMPPKKAPQPSPERRQRLRGWVADYLKAEALASAGDPGPVVLRRLGNAEYTYTLLDLTGVDLAARPRVSGRWRRRRGIHQHRQCARDVAGLALEVPRRRQEDRRPCRALARRHPVFTGRHQARLDGRGAGADPELLRPVYRLGRRHAGELARHRLRHQPGGPAAAGKIPGRDDPRARGPGLGREERRGCRA